MSVVTLLISLFVVQPLLEYWVQRAMHIYNVQWHAAHYRQYGRGKYWSYRGSRATRLFVLLLIYVRWNTTALMVLKYELAHIIVHRMPGLRHWHRHHFLHHTNPSVNFGVSAMWPDRLFGTLVP